VILTNKTWDVAKSTDAKPTIPLDWREPCRVTVSLTDLDEQTLTTAFAVMALTPRHVYRLKANNLNMRALLAYVTAEDRPRIVGLKAQEIRGAVGRKAQGDAAALVKGEAWPLPNVAVCGLASRQEHLDSVLIDTLRCPAACRMIEIYPLAGKLNFRRSWEIYLRAEGFDELADTVPALNAGAALLRENGVNRLDGVIINGGHENLPCRIEWVESVIDQVAVHGDTPLFIGSLGKCVIEAPEKQSEWPAGTEFETTRHGMRVKLKSRNGSRPSEWPDHLKHQRFPELLKAMRGD
jgi:hypothetical protein